MSEEMSNEKIEELIRKYERIGADPSCPGGTTSLHFACDEAKPEVVRELLSRGADPNAKDRFALTPLHVVAKGWGNLRCAELLLEAKADPNLRETSAGMTPLHWAAAKADVDFVKLLLDYGADPALRNDEGKTALEIVEINHAYTASAEKHAVMRLLRGGVPSEDLHDGRPAEEYREIGMRTSGAPAPKAKRFEKKKVIFAAILLLVGAAALYLAVFSGA